MANGPEFRRAAVVDIPTLQALARAIWREYYPRILSTDQIEYMLEKMYGSGTLREEMRRGMRFEIIEVHGKPAGYLAYAFDGEGKTAKLSKLYLAAEYRGQGLGRAMLEHVRDSARRAGAREIVLTVNKGNSDSIAAYEKFGFIVSEAAVFDIGGGYVMDDYVMRLKIQPE